MFYGQRKISQHNMSVIDFFFFFTPMIYMYPLRKAFIFQYSWCWLREAFVYAFHIPFIRCSYCGLLTFTCAASPYHWAQPFPQYSGNAVCYIISSALSDPGTVEGRGLSKGVLSFLGLRTLWTHGLPRSDTGICLQRPKFGAFYHKLRVALGRGSAIEPGFLSAERYKSKSVG